MGKTLIALSLILLAALSLGGISAYADDNENENEVKPSKIIEIIQNSRFFEISGEGNAWGAEFSI